jgi:hypothetical protein
MSPTTSTPFYISTISDRVSRVRMFAKGSKDSGLLQLKQHNTSAPVVRILKPSVNFFAADLNRTWHYSNFRTLTGSRPDDESMQLFRSAGHSTN